MARIERFLLAGGFGRPGQVARISKRAFISNKFRCQGNKRSFSGTRAA
jgi:hypothetical protein